MQKLNPEFDEILEPRFWYQNDPQNTFARTRRGGFYDCKFGRPRATVRRHVESLVQCWRKREGCTVALRRRSYGLRVLRLI